MSIIMAFIVTKDLFSDIIIPDCPDDDRLIVKLSLSIVSPSSHITVYPSILDCTVNDIFPAMDVNDCLAVNSPPIELGA